LYTPLSPLPLFPSLTPACRQAGLAPLALLPLLKNMKDFTIEEKKELLDLARQVIWEKLEGKEFKKETKNEKFLEKRGVFVSLHKNSELRGCIGYIEPVTTIWDAVQGNAFAAAFDDPRFLPVQKDEFNDLEIEISILTIPQKTKIDYIRQGIDGVVIQFGHNKATYLPQVWTHVKTKEEFLNSLCIKAGLPENAWKNPNVEIFSYEVENFSEKQI